MSIVSAKTGIVAIPTRKRGAVNAVQLGFDSIPDYEFAAQLPTVNQFRKIRVPSANPRAPPKDCDVPLKFLQEGDDYPRANSEEYSGEKLKGADPTPGDEKLRSLRELLAETLVGQYFDSKTTDPVFPYNDGIKPGRRAIKFDEVREPAGQMYRE